MLFKGIEPSQQQQLHCTGTRRNVSNMRTSFLLAGAVFIGCLTTTTTTLVGAFAPVLLLSRTPRFATKITPSDKTKAIIVATLNAPEKKPCSAVCIHPQKDEILRMATTRSYLQRRTALMSTSKHNIQESSNNALVDCWLSRLTTAFPVFVLSAAVLGLVRPDLLMWVNRGSTVTAMLAAVMCGTGLTLQKEDFAAVLAKPANRLAVPLGVVCQFAIMPLTAFGVGKALLLKGTTESAVSQALFLGLCLVGCSPGGTASNLVSLIAGADVALSVILTTCSTLAAVVMTPLLVKLLVGSTIATTTTTASSVSISGMALCAATAKVVLLPVFCGMFLKAKTPRIADAVSRFTPFCSVLLVSLICGGVVAQTAPLLVSSPASLVCATTAAAAGATATTGGSGLRLAMIALGLTTASPLASILAFPLVFGSGNGAAAAAAATTTATAGAVGLPVVVTSVLLLHLIGFGVGYLVPKILYPGKEKTARTISIEVGMQNSALAVVLARSIPGLHPAASLPGALSATVHSCLGSLLAAGWRLQGTPKEDE